MRAAVIGPRVRAWCGGADAPCPLLALSVTQPPDKRGLGQQVRSQARPVKPPGGVVGESARSGVVTRGVEQGLDFANEDGLAGPPLAQVFKRVGQLLVDL